MSDDFLNDLERELVAGWRRAGRTRPRVAWRRAGRAGLAAALALLVVGVALLALVGPRPSDEAEPAAADLRLAVLERAPTPADRRFQREARDSLMFRDRPDQPGFEIEAPVRSSLRVVADIDGRRFVVGRGEDGGRCFYSLDANGSGGGGCDVDDWSPPPISEHRYFVFGIAFDGTDRVTAIFRDGTTRSVPVRDNHYVIPERAPVAFRDLIGVRFEQDGLRTGRDFDREVSISGENRFRRATMETASTPWALHLRGQTRVARGDSLSVALTGPRRADQTLRRARPFEGLPHHEYFYAPPDTDGYTRMRVLVNGRPWFAGPVPPPVRAPEVPSGADRLTTLLGGYPIETEPPGFLEPRPERAFSIPPPPGPHVEYTPGRRDENRDWLITARGDELCAVFGPKTRCGVDVDGFERGELRQTVRGQVIGIVPSAVVAVRARGGTYPVRDNAYRVPFDGSVPGLEFVRR